MTEEDLQPNDPGETPGQESFALGLFFAFIPVTIALIFRIFDPQPQKETLVFAFIVSVIFSLISSCMLFSGRIALAKLVGVGFLILNGLIALLLGLFALARS